MVCSSIMTGTDMLLNHVMHQSTADEISLQAQHSQPVEAVLAACAN